MQHHRFSGFYPETLQFFTDLRFHNEKAWFDAHRDDFEAYVKSPMEALAMDLEPLMARIDPSLDLSLRRVVSRIYRDARYARGVPYWDHMWMSYKPMGKTNSECFAYYFFIRDDAWGCGVGFYDKVPEMIDAFRARLLREPEAWRQCLLIPGVSDFEVGGKSMRRPKETDLPEDTKPWYQFQHFYFERMFPITPEVYSADLRLHVERLFKALEPVYRFVQGWDLE